MTQAHFGDVLDAFIIKAGQTSGRLSKLTKISKSTIDSWRDGRVKRPQNTTDIIRLMAALRLYEAEANRLLVAARQPTIRELYQSTSKISNRELWDALQFWSLNLQSDSGTVVQIPVPFKAPRLDEYLIPRKLIEKLVVSHITTEDIPVLLHGMGGSGKSTLATQLAYKLKAHFADGVLWVSLRNVSTNGQLNDTLLKAKISDCITAYGREPHEAQDILGLASLLREVLAHKQTLLILDNATMSEEVKPFLPPSTSPSRLIVTTRNQRLLRGQATPFAVSQFSTDEGVQLLNGLLGERRVAAEPGAAQKLIEVVGGCP